MNTSGFFAHQELADQSRAGAPITPVPITTLACPIGIWMADSATGFHTYYGFDPDYEYGTDADHGATGDLLRPGFAFCNSKRAVPLRPPGRQPGYHRV